MTDTRRQQLLQRAHMLLTRREYSRQELRNKLQKNDGDASLIEDILDKLVAQDLQNDARFAENFVRYRLGRGQGPVRIEQALQQLGIAQSLIDQYLHDDPYIDWENLAEQARKKKFGAMPPADYHERAKQSRFLYYRGFSSEQISALFKTVV